MASFGIVCVSGSEHLIAACLDTDDFTRFPTAHTRVRILLDLLLRHHIEFQCKPSDLNNYIQVTFRYFIPVVFYVNVGGWVRRNTTVVGSHFY